MGRGGRRTVFLVIAVLLTVGACLLAWHLSRPPKNEAPELFEELVRYFKQRPECGPIEKVLNGIWFKVPPARPVIHRLRPRRRGHRDIMRDLKQTGPSGAALLREQLRHNDPLRRWLATAAIAGIGDPRGAAAIAPLIDDPNSEVREAAIIALARLWGPGARDALVAKLKDTADRTEIQYFLTPDDPGGFPGKLLPRRTSTRAYVAWWLGRCGDDTAIPALSEAARDTEPEVAQTAQWAISQIKRRAGARGRWGPAPHRE